MKALGKILPVIAGLLVILTYLLLRAATPDAGQHERTLDALRSLMLNDAALHRDVLRTRAGLLRNYDPLVGSVDGLRDAFVALQPLGDRAASAAAAQLDRQLARLNAALAEQEELIETFKSSNALLQNSLSYFNHASLELGALTAGERHGAAWVIGSLANAMLRFTADASAENAAAVTASLDRLAGLPLPQAARKDTAALIAHGRLIVATLPVVDDIVDRLLASPTSARTRTLQDLYVEYQGRAAARAGLFRVLLYIAAVLLVAYLAYLFLRLRANARALAERSRALQARSDFEHLIAGISAQFIDLPRERIAEGVRAGLERLGRHAGADRAYVMLATTDGTKADAAYGWCREGIATPSGWPEDISAIGPRSTPAEYERQGCIEVARVAALPPGPEKAVLQQRDARSWLCVPLRHGADRIGFMGLDRVAQEAGWADADIALLRMAGETFANALMRRRAERDREMLEFRLRQAQRMEAIGTLAGGIAHDFNNILGAILGYAEMALGRIPKGSRPWRHVLEVRKSGERGKKVVDQILTFSRRREHQRQPIAMKPLLEEAIGMLRASLPATIALRLSLQDDDAVVVGDPTQIQQVVMNLCANAAQAMDGHGTVEVALDELEQEAGTALSHGALAPGCYVRLAVTDTGHGMDEATMERIFEPFFTTRAAGTGLGLATVHGIVADHGGALDIRSRPGAGSRFAVYFPRAEVPPAAQPGEEASLPLGSGETILFVEDERSLLLLGEEMVAGLGYEPVGFGNAAQALAAFRADPQRFDLALTDEVMPGMTGSQLAAALHAIRPELPILLMTGYGGRLDPDRIPALGIREVLMKPLLSRDMAEAIARYLPPRTRQRRRLQM